MSLELRDEKADRDAKSDIKAITKLPTREKLFETLQIITDEEMIARSETDNAINPNGTDTSDRSPFFLIEEGVKYGEDIDGRGSVPVIITDTVNRPGRIGVLERKGEVKFGYTLVGGGIKTDEDELKAAIGETDGEIGSYYIREIESLGFQLQTILSVNHKDPAGENRLLVQVPTVIDIDSNIKTGDAKPEVHDKFDFVRIDTGKMDKSMFPPNVWYILQRYLGKETIRPTHRVKTRNQCASDIVEALKMAKQ